MPSDHYDVIVIGSGPGGATLASRLAPTGKRILILERGGYLKRELANWNTKAVFGDARYQAKETWSDGAGKPFNPGLHYYVGGNSKVYGSPSCACAARISARCTIRPACPRLGPWATISSILLPRGRGALPCARSTRRGPRRTECGVAVPLPTDRARAAHRRSERRLGEARAQTVPPAAWHLARSAARHRSPDAGQRLHPLCRLRRLPCLTNGKADAQIACIDPMLKAHLNVTLLTDAYVGRLETDAGGKTVTGVAVTRAGSESVTAPTSSSSRPGR